ncbi:UNVERIFIED_CONTAM: hypothetical protein Scaly_2470000 [Sesamum calycinum]|uniref:Dirigent protein n=1 Tax=Sesamum calycinum TaxID=2727403 RepID=A0AAW2LRF8_9LAMI
MRLYYTMFMLVSMAMGGAYAAIDNVIQMPMSDAENPKPVDEWFHSLDQAKETRTKLHFYFQDVLGGDSPTVWKVAESAVTSTSATTFGQINMVDDLLTAGPEPGSEVVGGLRGRSGSLTCTIRLSKWG